MTPSLPSPLAASALLGLAWLALGGAVPLGAAERAALRGDVTVSRDALVLGDLVANVPPALAETPLFRAPALGQAGTIQVRRILGAAEGLGLGSVETGGRLQVTVTRAARHVGAAEIEAALRKRLAKELGADPVATGIAFDGVAPEIVVSPEVTGEVAVADLTLDRRSRRVTATVWLGPSPAERRAQLRVSGVAVETIEVAVATRAVERGQQIRPADVSVERRPRDLVPSDAVLDGAPLDGRVARRPLVAGALLRSGDLVRPEIVGRGDIVTVVYEMPGVSLSMRAKSSDAGALGDTVSVLNPQSKKALQAVVVGPGRVSVNASPPSRLVAAAIPAPARPAAP